MGLWNAPLKCSRRFENLAYTLALLIPGTGATWLLIAVVFTALTFALFAFAFYRTGHTVIAALLEAAAWLFGVAIIVILAAAVAATKVTWLLAGVLTALTFASLAFAFSRSGHTMVAAILAAGAWLFGAFAVLKQFPAYLNRWDSQQARNEGVFAH